MGAKKTTIDAAERETAQEFAARIEKLHLPRYSEIPDFNLYMDQLITYLSDQVGMLDAVGDKPITPSMVNNYVKQKLIPQPKGKRYARMHVAYLIAVCVLKRTFSISDIDRMIALEMGQRYAVEASYDFFIGAFEENLRVLFCGKTSAAQLGDARLAATGPGFAVQVENIQDLDQDHRVAIAAAASAACKVYCAKQLDWLQAANDERAAQEAQAAVDAKAKAKADAEARKADAARARKGHDDQQK